MVVSPFEQFHWLHAEWHVTILCTWNKYFQVLLSFLHDLVINAPLPHWWFDHMRHISVFGAHKASDVSNPMASSLSKSERQKYVGWMLYWMVLLFRTICILGPMPKMQTFCSCSPTFLNTYNCKYEYASSHQNVGQAAGTCVSWVVAYMWPYSFSFATSVSAAIW